MTPDLLRAAGELLHGRDVWKKALAADLGVNERTVHRWARGQFVIPPGIGPELVRLLQGRKGEAERLISLLLDGR